MPQLILSIISIIEIYNQDFITIDDEEKEYENKKNKSEGFFDFVNYMIYNDSNNTIDKFNSTTNLTDQRITALKISPIINLVFYLLTVILTFFKIMKNF